MKLANLANGTILADNVEEATSFIQRLRGLMFTKQLPIGYALHLNPCRSIHTFFMQYPLDVLYLDSNLQIIATEERILPGRIGRVYHKVESVIELSAGVLQQTATKAGHHLIFIK